MERKQVDYMRKNRKQWYTNIGIGIAIYLCFRFLFFPFLPLIFAFLFYRLLEPISRYLQKCSYLPRKMVVPGIMVIFTLVSGSLIYCVGWKIWEQFCSFTQQLPAYISFLEKVLGQICENCDQTFCIAKGKTWTYVTGHFLKNGDTMKMLTCYLPQSVVFCAKCMMYWLGVYGLVLLLTFLLLWDMQGIKGQIKGWRLVCVKEAKRYWHPLERAGFVYLKTQGILFLAVAIISSLGFFFTKSPYQILFGILVACIDAIPLLGSGLIFIPLAVLMFWKGKIYYGLIYSITFLVCQGLRQIWEPKLMGDQLGIHPFFFILSMYFGVRLFGPVGVITGPLACVAFFVCMKVNAEANQE